MVQPLTFGYTTPVRKTRESAPRASHKDSVCSRALVATRHFSPAAMKHGAAAFIAVLVFALGMSVVRFASQRIAAAAVPAAAPLTIPVTVAPGDTLWSLSRHYGSADINIQERIDSLAKANAMQSGMPLIAGQRLLVPVTNAAVLAQLQTHVASR